AATVTSRAVEWLKDWHSRTGKGGHFLLWAHYYDPHRPFDAPEPFKSRYPDDGYAAEVAYTDAKVGRLLEELERLDLTDETLVVVIADHGESLGDHGEYTHGVFLYDATMRVPFIVAGPEIASGVVIDQQVRSIDVLPTVAEYLGLSPGEKVQGTSLLPALSEGRGVRTTYAYLETLYPKTHLGWAELRGVRTDEWKLIVAPRPELYRIDQDPEETTNVIDRFPVEADRLQKQIWEVAGPPESLGELKYQPLDQQTQEELASLGYVSAGVRRDLRIDMSGPDPKDRIHELQVLEDAGELMNVGRYTDAIPLLAKLVREDSTNPLVFQHLAVCHTRLGEYKRALQVYETAVDRGADTDETHAEMGELYIRFGNLRQAIEAMEESARRNPTNLQNLINLATAYLQMEEFSEARRAIRAIQAQDEDNAQAFNLLGILEVQRGNDLVARGYFEKAVQFEPEMAEPYMNLGIIAQEAGQREQAISYFKRFLERAGSDNPELLARVRAVIAELESGS
ncbi:MAG TPA: tetratricopeptide repeat protein, partial [Acidobacteriota bacterium]|nr:tetratricopeptide repeat protein [Acidobacteriota bacterium]